MYGILKYLSSAFKIGAARVKVSSKQWGERERERTDSVEWEMTSEKTSENIGQDRTDSNSARRSLGQESTRVSENGNKRGIEQLD